MEKIRWFDGYWMIEGPTRKVTYKGVFDSVLGRDDDCLREQIKDAERKILALQQKIADLHMILETQSA